MSEAADRAAYLAKKKAYYYANREKYLAQNRAWRQRNPEKVKASRKSWAKRNPEKIKEIKLRYELANVEKCKARRDEWKKKNAKRIRDRNNKRLQEDIDFKLTKNLRNRLYMAVKKSTKSGSAIENLGCSVEELKERFESMFEPGMSWDNWGEWHIDHVVPLMAFDLSDREQLEFACHYTNLQPLWAADNIRKGKSLEW